jgi:bacillithiol system protein YtxJ
VATRFTKISGTDALDELIEQSRNETVVLFNHDPHCPISARAYAQMEQFEGDISLVDVSRERTLTKEIQGRTGVRHESPQVIVLRGGEPVWSASHFAITVDAVNDATGAAKAE